MMTPPSVAVIWIDWYAYHVARFEAVANHVAFRGRAAGIELVGGEGVHAGMRFRDVGRSQLPIITLLPSANWSTAGQWRLAVMLWQRLTALRPSLVMVPGYYTLPALAAAVWGRLHRARTVLMSESTEADHARRPWKEAIKGTLVRNLFNYAVVGGTRHRDYLLRLGFDGSRIGERYNVVDNAFFADGVDALRAAGRPDDFAAPNRYFLFVGRLAPEKNLERLLRSFAVYRQHGGQWSLVIAGDGPSREALTTLVASLKLAACVTFAGHRSTQELLPYYAFASAFVLPSLREPWGLVVNEAMASALPVLVSQICGAAGDLVREGENGFSFDPQSGEELTRLLLQLSRLSNDARGAMGRRSREIIDNFSVRHWASEVARIAEA
jgi:1,2-diacylglycerol 3-alpha-glucosyltransferase